MARDIHICALERAVGRCEVCPEAGCPFWEPGGTVLSGRCAFERLDLSGRPEVARELLRVRELLELPASGIADGEALHLFHRLLNESEGE
jgi:hypothetical protein